MLCSLWDHVTALKKILSKLLADKQYHALVTKMLENLQTMAMANIADNTTLLDRWSIA